MLQFANVTKNYGSKVLYSNASFQINAGEKIGLVGPNGAGKTTVFRLLAGEQEPDAGRVVKVGKPKIGYFSQQIEEMQGRSALQEVIAAVGDAEAIQNRLKEIEAKLSDPDLDPAEMEKILEEYGEKQSQFEAMGGYDLESRAAAILTGLGIGPDDYHRPTESFSGGWKMRIALARILAFQPDVLLMDEPTNHLDLESILWLEEWIAAFPGALLMTSHDRDFLNRLVSRVVEVANKTITSYSGNYDFYERERDIRREQLIASAKRQEEMLAKEEEFIARFAARASHAAQVQSRVKKLEKIDRIEIPPEERVVSFEWPAPPRGGDDVVKIEGLGKIWKTDEGKDKLVFQGANALVRRMDRVAVVGVNGAGKSTLLKIIAGHAEPTSGKAVVGAGIKLGYFSQNSMDVLNPKLTVFEALHEVNPHATVGWIRNLGGAFKFSQDEIEKKISVLSGGEKSRVVLATILSQAPNFLVLDEPTNHLDIASREALLDAIKRFPGTVMIVSHDRHFLREITTRVFELDKHQLLVTDAHYDYYLSKKSQRR
ncbi:MAG TPA: ABC-F family ATP-binding cassette domain-containing protein [Bdellovibrionota bacterium]|jgi:ATP-binding cassette subfamily F protein 3